MADINSISNANTVNSKFPNQRVSTKKKMTKEWQKDCMDYFMNNAYMTYNRRKSWLKMRENRDYFNSVLNREKLSQLLDPLSTSPTGAKADFPYTFYSMLEQPFATLFSEEYKRKYDMRAFVVNSTAINKKDEEFKARLGQFLTMQAQKEAIDENQLKKELGELEKLLKYDLQSAHEKMSNQILQAHLHNPDMRLKEKFNTAFQDLEVIGEEVFCIDRLGNDPVVRHINSENFYVFGLGENLHIEDGTAWAEVRWLTINKIVEEFYDGKKDLPGYGNGLNDDDIDSLYQMYEHNTAFMMPTPISSALLVPNTVDADISTGNVSNMVQVNSQGDFETVSKGPLTNSKWVDGNGNIRVVHVQWLSNKKVLKVYITDPETSEEDYVFADETYKPAEGERTESLLFNELMEGTIIGRDIYTRCGVCPVQMRSATNPATVRPTFIGMIRAFANGESRSRLDMVKEYQDLFNIWMNKLTELWTTNLGKVATIDLSKIPANMPTDEWFVWLKRFHLVYENSFEEGKQGQLAGNMQQGNRVIDMSLATEINQAIQMLNVIEEKINKLTAVPTARQGDLQGNEGLGVVQQSLIASTTQTEIDFIMHEYVKAKVLETLLEYTKVLWKDAKGIRRQYLLDDMSSYLLMIDNTNMLMEADLGVRITNTNKSEEMMTILRNSIQPAVQAGTLSVADMAEIFLSESPSEVITKLRQSEEDKVRQQQEAQQQQEQARQQELQLQQQFEERKHQMEMERMAKEYDFKMQIEMLRIQWRSKQLDNSNFLDANNNGVDDNIELEKQKLVNEMKDKEFAVKKEVEKMKIESAEKIAKMNANKPSSK